MVTQSEIIALIMPKRGTQRQRATLTAEIILRRSDAPNLAMAHDA